MSPLQSEIGEAQLTDVPIALATLPTSHAVLFQRERRLSLGVAAGGCLQLSSVGTGSAIETCDTAWTRPPGRAGGHRSPKHG